MFSSAAALCIYNCLVVLNQEVDDRYWSALLVLLSLSSCHTYSTYTHTHTHLTLRAAAVHCFAKLGQFVASFRRRLRDVPAQQLMTSWGRKKEKVEMHP